MKKFVTLLLVMVMILSMAATASAASITITPPATTDGTETGITYTAYKIFDATISGDAVAYTIKSNSPYYAAVEASGYFTLTPSASDATVVIVEAKETYTEAVADTFADTLKAVTGATAAGSVTGATDGKYTISGLDNGYYLVTSSVGSDLILKTIGDVTVATKNEYPSQEKKVEGLGSTTADMGAVLTFTIDVKIPEDAVGEIVVHDKMTGLEYQGMTAVEGITETKAPGDGCAVHFTLTADYVAKNTNKTVIITYTAKVIADVANNEAWLVDGSYTTKPSETDVYSTDVVINKVDGSDKTTPLAGAEFVLYKEVGGAKQYYKLENGVVSWVDSVDAATKYTTGADGKAEFTDIADGTYYLLETKAPEGYNKLTKAEQVTVTSNGGTTTDVTVTIENNAGTELPSTGGVGTTMFYVIGGLMMLMAVVLLVTKKRMASAE